jgi:hypothetical protein
VTSEVKSTTAAQSAADAKTAHQPEVSGTTGATLVATGTEKDKDLAGKNLSGDDIVVAPHEPTTLPEDEVR